MHIKILGSGCKKCNTLYEKTTALVKENNLPAQVEKVEDIEQIISYGVMMTPALVIDDEVICKANIPSDIQILNWIKERIK